MEAGESMSEIQDREQGIQNEFLNEARKNRTRLSIFLTSGKRLTGRIKSFDRFSIVLDAGGGAEEMVFKHAIATISTAAPRPAGTEGGGGYRGTRPQTGEQRTPAASTPGQDARPSAASAPTGSADPAFNPDGKA